MYAKLEYFNDFSERTPEEKERGTLTPIPGGSDSGDVTVTDPSSGPTDMDDFAPSSKPSRKPKEDYTKYLDGWDKPSSWSHSPSFVAEDAETFLTGSDRVELGEDSKYLIKFTNMYKDHTLKLEAYCDKITASNEKRKADFDRALIWNK